MAGSDSSFTPQSSLSTRICFAVMGCLHMAWRKLGKDVVFVAKKGGLGVKHTEFMAGATTMSFFFMSMLLSVSHARMTEVSKLSDMPLTTCKTKDTQPCHKICRPSSLRRV